MKPVRSLVLALAWLGAASVFAAPSLLTYPTANLVLGQKTFVTNTTANPASPASLNLPTGVAVDPTTGKVFVSDQANNRVLRFASRTALLSGANAEIVIGQVNFSATAAATTQTGLSAPGDLFVDRTGRLWIADTGNSRVLLFQLASAITSMPAFADRVFGQPDFVTATAAPTQTKLANPAGVCLDSLGTLWVADTGSHRVVGFKNAAGAIVNGPPADYLLGQATYTGNVAGTTQKTFFNPTGVSADAAGHLWVADRDNNRALMFANPPLIVQPFANVVLGQADYIAATAGATAAKINRPTGVFASGSSLFLADDNNNRVLRFDNAANRVDGSAANIVVGQPTFTAKLPGLSAKQFATLDGHISVDASGSLWVADRLNNRILRFTPTNRPPMIVVNGRQKFSIRKKSLTLYGTAADDAGILRVSWALGSGTYVRAVGTTNWSARVTLKKGKNFVTFRSVDTNNVASAPVVITIHRK